MRRDYLLALSLVLALSVMPASEAQQRNARRTSMPTGAQATLAAPLNVVLGRPDAQGVVANVLSVDATELYITYGSDAAALDRRSDTFRVKAGETVELTLSGLPADRRAYYRVWHRSPDGSASDNAFVAMPVASFHTQRAKGSPFVFEVQGDSHPERRHQFDPALYRQTLAAVAADRPDFYILMGDDFSVDTLREVSAERVADLYVAQRAFLSPLAQGSPLFLVNGNHEQAAAANLDGTPDNVAVWAQRARNRYFPQPAPDGFYSGNAEAVTHIGLLRNYFAWTWGDALFVIIDPYWHSSGPVDNPFQSRAKGSGGGWGITLGDAQYRWLAQTLTNSRARYKFVFSHHVLGTGRGGIEQAHLYEWGGRGKNSADEFTRYRPDWALPIHPLMVKTGVTAFFQGHDHVFARQELDGITYQTVPQPADPNYTLNYSNAYRSGDIVPNSGRLRVSVGPERARVEYVRSWLPGAAVAPHEDGEIAFAYDLRPAQPHSPPSQ
ncbi:metallophosphoesterase family protein [Viridibacterium curvum]|uniref:Calcineurin-like phosphoesterase domain-containing protein n=1 Tax=Viridibacterium curvum TaxID=1101404 RepID=A0ABP9QSI5_9RHOO